MTALASPFWALFMRSDPRTTRAVERTDPPRERRAPPVFIHDAITPWRGETMLLHQLRQGQEAAGED